jgi:hypothetical protein
MRANISRFAAAHGQRQLYRETIALFWMRLLRHFLDVADPAWSEPEAVRRARARYGSTRFLFAHYSREHIFTERARRTWVEPDLLALPF